MLGTKRPEPPVQRSPKQKLGSHLASKAGLSLGSCGTLQNLAEIEVRSILRRGWVGVRVEHCYNLGAPPAARGGGGNNLNLTFKGSGSTQP